MNTEVAIPITYSIEVSGWDLAEDFFVERAHLEWSAGEGEKICVRRPVRTGAVVFLRLIHPTDLGPSFPVAYLVQDVRKFSGTGLWELRLRQLRTRSAARDEFAEEQSEVVEEHTK
jgi:hypothetical protein